MTPHNIHQDSQMLETLMEWTNENQPNSEISLSTGYFNLSPLAKHIFSRGTKISKPWKILTSAPQANGFYQSAGISYYIPDTYRSIEYSFLSSEPGSRPPLATNAQGEECIYEYIKDNCTFHAKGLWIDTPDLMATVIGSSNFGYRSFERDLECQLLIVTADQHLTNTIRADRDELFKSANLVSANDLLRDGLPAIGVRTAAYLLKSYF